MSPFAQSAPVASRKGRRIAFSRFSHQPFDTVGQDPGHSGLRYSSFCHSSCAHRWTSRGSAHKESLAQFLPPTFLPLQGGPIHTCFWDVWVLCNSWELWEGALDKNARNPVLNGRQDWTPRSQSQAEQQDGSLTDHCSQGLNLVNILSSSVFIWPNHRWFLFSKRRQATHNFHVYNLIIIQEGGSSLLLPVRTILGKDPIGLFQATCSSLDQSL